MTEALTHPESAMIGSLPATVRSREPLSLFRVSLQFVRIRLQESSR